MKYASLCILAYERHDFLERSFSSLKRNTDYPHERIIHDDGSVDFNVLFYIAEQDDLFNLSYTILNHNKNRGIERAMRACIGVSTGDYIFKLDTDLEYLPNWLSTVVSILENNKDIGACGLFDYKNYDPQDDRFEIIEEREDCLIVSDFVNSGYGFRREVFTEWGHGMGDDGWQGYLRNVGLKSAIPKQDVVHNFGFGANKSIYVKDGKVEIFNKEPKLFNI